MYTQTSMATTYDAQRRLNCECLWNKQDGKRLYVRTEASVDTLRGGHLGSVRKQKWTATGYICLGCNKVVLDRRNGVPSG